jgi:hypothetical protein
MKKWLLAGAALGAALLFMAQQAGPQDIPTVNGSITITVGNTFQTLLAAVATNSAARRSLTIQNNNTLDNCWVFIGSTTPTASTSIMLTVTQRSYQRYFPYVPSDQVQATCATAGDTLYVDTQ